MALKKKASEKKTVESIETIETVESAAVAATEEPAKAPALSTPAGNVFINNESLIEACTEAEFGTFVQLAASNGTHMGSDEKDYGKEIKFQGIIQRNVWKMSPGETGEEATEYFQVSYAGPEELEDAKAEAIEAGYDRADIRKYIELFGLITECEGNPDAEGEVVILSLSPSSIRNWKPLEGKLRVKAAFGKLKAQEVIPGCPAVVFKSVATPVSWKGNNYTAFNFEIV